MQMHPKKRLEIFIEAPLLGRIVDRLERAGATGYSVLPVIAGAGRDGAWSTDGQVSRFPRAAVRLTAADGRTGTGWIEWNQPEQR